MVLLIPPHGKWGQLSLQECIFVHILLFLCTAFPQPDRVESGYHRENGGGLEIGAHALIDYHHLQ